MILVCFTREVSLLISVAKWDKFYQRWWFLFFTNRKLFFVTVVYLAFVFELFHCPENAETNLTVSATSSLQLFLRPTSGTYRVEYKWNHLVVCMCCWYVCKYISWIWNINQSKCMENFYVISLYKMTSESHFTTPISEYHRSLEILFGSLHQILAIHLRHQYVLPLCAVILLQMSFPPKIVYNNIPPGVFKLLFPEL